MRIAEDSVRKLAKLLEETHLTEIEYQIGDHRIRVVRGGGGLGTPLYAPTPLPSSSPTPETPLPSSQPPALPKGETVPSPMVGTVYLAAEPGGASFIKVGDVVAKGATLLIIEAMKVMNPIRAPREGRVVEICVSDAQPVEFGESLVILE